MDESFFECVGVHLVIDYFGIVDNFEEYVFFGEEFSEFLFVVQDLVEGSLRVQVDCDLAEVNVGFDQIHDD